MPIPWTWPNASPLPAAGDCPPSVGTEHAVTVDATATDVNTAVQNLSVLRVILLLLVVTMVFLVGIGR